MISKQTCQKIIESACTHASDKVDGIEVLVTSSDVATSRFANNGMTQNQAPERTVVSCRVLVGHRQTRLETSNISNSGVKELVDNAVTAVKLLAEDESIMQLPTPAQTLLDIPKHFSRYDVHTANMNAEERAQAIKSIIAVADEENLSSAGVYASGTEIYALGNSNGMLHFHSQSSAECSVTMTAPDSSGWAKAHSFQASQVDAQALARHAARNAKLSANPVDVVPGKYTVILSPSAVLDLLSFMWGEFTATSHIDKQSSLLNKVGQKVFGENINIEDDVFHPLQHGEAFDGEGLPRTRVRLVENGVIKNLVYGRHSAHKMNVHSTGHGLLEPAPMGEYPVNLVVQGGDISMDQMIASTETGILLSRVWYVRMVDPATVLLTGMTRDGTFMIENGALKCGLKNLRFNVSIIELLNKVVALSPAVRAAGEEGFPAVVPALKIADFNFSSTTKF